MDARNTLILGLLLLGTASALAQPADAPSESWMPNNAYVALRGSYAFSGNATTTYAPTTPMTQLRGSYASGGGGSLALGAYLPLNLRLEIEGVYRYQSLSTLTLNGAGVAAGGHTQIAAPMVNLLWDVPMPVASMLQPFVGMGVGAAYVSTQASGGGNTYMSQNRWDPAYSFIAGMALPLDDASRLTAMYRWMQVRDAGHKCAVSGTVDGNCLANSVNSSAVDLGYELNL